MNVIILISFSVSLLLLNGLSCRPQVSEEDMMADLLRLHSSRSPRIIGGRRAKPGEIPYIVSVQWDGNHFCGASIVETANGGHIAVTAAHCVFYEGRAIPTSKLTVTAGALTINGNTEEPNCQTLTVQDVIIYEGYHENDLGIPVNDIAILILSGSFQENEFVKPAKLPSSNHFDQDSIVRVSGWGVTEEGPELSKHLRLVALPLVSNEDCAEKYSALDGDEMIIHETNICAGEECGGYDTCQGDSGGPLATKSNELLGITSWGFGCGLPEFPGVYTRVSSFVHWINQSTIAVLKVN